VLNFGRRIIKVTFYDQTSGTVISSARMPLERLPESFAVDTVLKMAGAEYIVVRAEPPTKPLFAASKELKVVVRKQPG